MTTTANPISGVRIRELRPGEDHLIDEVFDGLSPSSRELRFHAPVPRLPASFRRSLAHVRPGERAGVVAVSAGRAVGLAHWIRDPETRTRADLSLSVIDRFQRQGVGTAMVRHLAVSAMRAGVEEFSCWVSPHNEAVVAMVSHLYGAGRAQLERELLLDVPEVRRRAQDDRRRRGGVVVSFPGGVRRPRTASSC